MTEASINGRTDAAADGLHAIKAGEGDQCIAADVEAVSPFGDSPIPFHQKLDGSEGSIFNV